MMDNKVVFKFNGGRGALLCSNCSIIVKTGKDFTQVEWAAMRGEGNIKSIYCDECKKTMPEVVEDKEKSKLDLNFMTKILPKIMEDEEQKENFLNTMVDSVYNVDKLINKNK